MPFGSAPRLSPGRGLALLEMQVAPATLFRGFRVERVGARQEVEERFALSERSQCFTTSSCRHRMFPSGSLNQAALSEPSTQMWPSVLRSGRS
jgi:hypothetical protein